MQAKCANLKRQPVKLPPCQVPPLWVRLKLGFPQNAAMVRSMRKPHKRLDCATSFCVGTRNFLLRNFDVSVRCWGWWPQTPSSYSAYIWMKKLSAKLDQGVREKWDGLASSLIIEDETLQPRGCWGKSFSFRANKHTRKLTFLSQFGRKRTISMNFPGLLENLKGHMRF